ncbi:PLP-dependent cysteine synthase family protein [Micromonospora sp. KLBMP9576]|uniref:PLP-dependent cysteine synthase family protein n=1 Tax=Micromonospora sp. KLBMP9576 TaxID=3424769 RepID=UPI003D8D05B9
MANRRGEEPEAEGAQMSRPAPATNLVETINGTPSVLLGRTPRPGDARMVAKLESVNPGGSLKDRSAWHIVREAERTGALRRGGTLIESSSGNFGVALAMIGANRGYRVIAVVDPKITETNLGLLQAYGAEVIVVHERDDSGSYHKTRIALANDLHRGISNSFRPDQCFNLKNGEAHYLTTGPELLGQAGDNLAAIVCTVSTGGQLGGISRYVKQVAPEVEVVGVDIAGSTVFGGEPHAYLTPGVGLSWTPANLDDLGRIDKVYMVQDEDTFVGCRVLARNEGILAGPSTGAAYLVATNIAMSLPATSRVAFLASDRGERYLHTAFSDEWMKSKAFSTVTSLEAWRERAQKATPLSADPARDCANYDEKLAEKLGSPSAGPTVHRHLKEVEL